MLCVAWIVFLHTPAAGHSWYDKFCCSGEDCFPVVAKPWKDGDADVFRLKNGMEVKVYPSDWRWLNKAGRVRPSRDDSFHVCVRESRFAHIVQHDVRCIYMPAGS